MHWKIVSLISFLFGVAEMCSTTEKAHSVSDTVQCESLMMHPLIEVILFAFARKRHVVVVMWFRELQFICLQLVLRVCCFR